MPSKTDRSFRILNTDEWLEFTFKHQGLNHYPCVLNRAGSMLLMAAVEYHHFPPNTPSNDNFHVNVLKWRETAWNIFSVPKERHQDVVATANALAMDITDNPPSMLFFGKSAMLVTAPMTANEKHVKETLVRAGILPKVVVDLFSGMEVFPGEVRTIHGVENNQRRLKDPVRPDEVAAIHDRETALIAAMSHGAKLSLKELADYAYGRDRVLPVPKPR